MKVAVAVFLLGVTIATSSVAQDAPDYLDDRSTADGLVKSLYNAINRKEFARAWSYYGGQKPSTSLEAFGDGYKNTVSIDTKVGVVTAEGAAGSTFYSVPVAIEAHGSGGEQKVFVGCYTARLANPQVQGEDFQPMHLDKGSLKPSQDSLASVELEKCGGGEAVVRDPVMAHAKASYAATYGTTCDRANPGTGLPDEEPEDVLLKYKDKTDPESDPERTARLISFPCFSGAYNFSTVYYLWDDINDLRQVEFARPEFDVVYENPDDTENSKVKEITVTGFSATDQLLNAEFDPETKTIISWEKWRGVGDASSNGTWTFRDGNFVLVKYDVDASYDGEMESQTIVDYESTP